MKPTFEDPSESEPLEFFELGRRIRRGLSACGCAGGASSGGDVFYLWLQLGLGDVHERLTSDQWLNVVDEAASLGVNWLVVTLGTSSAREHVPALCLWANQTYQMVVCLHAATGDLTPTERKLLLALPPESSYLLVEPEHADAFADLAYSGVRVEMATPALPGATEPCDYPHRMVFVDAMGRLYTCGLVSGESDFFLGSVFDGSLNEIIHNPQLPHSVSAAQPGAHQSCSGCPPLVAKYLCPK